MDLRRFIEEKWVRNGKICHLWEEPAHWYRYPLYKGELVLVPLVGVPVPIRQRGIDTGTGASINPVFVPLALLSLVFIHRLFRDPNKGLTGLHIRIYERENVPYLITSGKLRFASEIFV